MMYNRGTAPYPNTWQPYYPEDWHTVPFQPDFTWTNVWWVTCTKCGNTTKMGDLYCPNCGEKMIQEVVEKGVSERILEKLDEILKELKKE